MKRQVKAAKKTEVLAPAPGLALERQFSQAVAEMVKLMGKLYKSQVLGGLHQATVEKFADAQVGNYATVFLGLAERVQKKLVSRFDDDRIERMVKDFLGKADAQTKEKFYKAIGAKVGLDPVMLMAEEGMKSTTNALMLETAQWVKKLRDETLEEFTANSLRAMTLGKSIDAIMAEYDGHVGKRVDHAKFVARNQVNNYSSLASKIRAQNLGITSAVWVTTKDERARPSHADRNGKEFDLDKGLYSAKDQKYLLPGVDYQCRCKSRFIIPEGD